MCETLASYPEPTQYSPDKETIGFESLPYHPQTIWPYMLARATKEDAPTSRAMRQPRKIHRSESLCHMPLGDSPRPRSVQQCLEMRRDRVRREISRRQLTVQRSGQLVAGRLSFATRKPDRREADRLALALSTDLLLVFGARHWQLGFRLICP